VSLRARLVLANLILLALLLSAFGTGVYAYVDAELHDGFNSALRNNAKHLDLLIRTTVRADNQPEAEKQVRAALDAGEQADMLAWVEGTSPQESIVGRSKALPADSVPPEVPHDQVVIAEVDGRTVLGGAPGAPETSTLAFYSVPFELRRAVSETERKVGQEDVPQRGDRTVLKGILTVARPVDVVEDPLRLLRGILIGGGLLALLAAALLGFGVSSALLVPLERMRAAAQRIGGERNFHLRMPVEDRRHELGRLAVTMNQMLGELEQAHGSLEATLEAQRRFVADASHELRTPVTAIRTNVEFLDRAPNARPRDRSEALADVLAEVRRMEQLVGDLLALARLEAAAAHVHHPLRLDHLLGDVQRDMVRQAPAGVEVSLGPMPEVWVAGDREDLRRGIWNLAENALKYGAPPVPGGRGGTGSAPQLISLSLAIVDGTAVVRVTDRGIGIAHGDQPYVFDRFWRAPEVRGRSGSGLGLAITKWVAQAHGGIVEVHSTPGVGSTFTMRLPVLDRPTAEDVPTAITDPVAATPAGKDSVPA
jgi:signal transduction histidine kinase